MVYSNRFDQACRFVRLDKKALALHPKSANQKVVRVGGLHAGNNFIRGLSMGDPFCGSQISLGVRRWSAWAPGLTNQNDWREWAAGRKSMSGDEKPDVGFVAPMMRRRLSVLSQMAFRVAADCLDDETETTAHVFCSRYGEYSRSYDILCGLAAGEAVSAAAFSMSVHNTAASLFSIETGHRALTTSVAGSEATLENAFLEAWSLLTRGEAERVLVVYHDEPLPELYRDQGTTVSVRHALALLCDLKPADDAVALRLAWRKRDYQDREGPVTENPVLDVLRLLLTGGPSVTLATGRLTWTWTRGDV